MCVDLGLALKGLNLIEIPLIDVAVFRIEIFDFLADDRLAALAAIRDVYFRSESAELIIGVFVAEIARVVGDSGYVSVLVVFIIKLI